MIGGGHALEPFNVSHLIESREAKGQRPVKLWGHEPVGTGPGDHPAHGAIGGHGQLARGGVGGVMVREVRGRWGGWAERAGRAELFKVSQLIGSDRGP